ncbi:Hypothetical predicted protein [Pelobates cultripes]|uniref:Uncharacterized protein n=1 Tax=Pelobates cultripes TaxID=61616 RepID=A0AAD1R7I0_PELCU|nr:Hypothetical predicted protein [Pelobates cultripes]
MQKREAGPRLILTQKSTLVGVVKTIPPACPVTQTRSYASAAATCSHYSQSRGIAAASAATSEDGSVHSGRSASSEGRGQSPANGLAEAARSLVYKSGQDTEEGTGGMRSRSPSRSSASRLGTPAGGSFPPSP